MEWLTKFDKNGIPTSMQDNKNATYLSESSKHQLDYIFN